MNEVESIIEDSTGNVIGLRYTNGRSDWIKKENQPTRATFETEMKKAAGMDGAVTSLRLEEIPPA